MLRTGQGRYYLPLATCFLAAGFPSPAEDHMERQLSLDEELRPRPASTFLLRAQGSDFEASGVHDGDILIVDRSLTPNKQDLVVAIEEGELRLMQFATVKQECEIWGVITAAIRRFRHA